MGTGVGVRIGRGDGVTRRARSKRVVDVDRDGKSGGVLDFSERVCMLCEEPWCELLPREVLSALQRAVAELPQTGYSALQAAALIFVSEADSQLEGIAVLQVGNALLQVCHHHAGPATMVARH